MEIQAKGKAPEIYEKLKTKFLDYKSQGKLKALGEIQWDDQACSAFATGTGFKSKIKCVDGKIMVELDLNFLLKAMRGQIEETIQKLVTKALA